MWNLSLLLVIRINLQYLSSIPPIRQTAHRRFRGEESLSYILFKLLPGVLVSEKYSVFNIVITNKAFLHKYKEEAAILMIVKLRDQHLATKLSLRNPIKFPYLEDAVC